MGKIFIVRHGQTSGNRALKYFGITDIELNEEGVIQAGLVSKRLEKERISRIYSSSLKRAIKTAEIIAKPHRISVELKEDLREINFGDWEGLSFQEIQKSYPHKFSKWQNNIMSFTMPQGESISKLKERVETCFSEILNSARENNVVIVTHGGPIKIILSKILSPNALKTVFWKIKQDKAALNIIENTDNTQIISLINDTSHLSPLCQERVRVS
ncbi:alpha-ribazole phosphatase [bacterium]|nr:alpha-ribazole phosphatase [bacterium]